MCGKKKTSKMESMTQRIVFYISMYLNDIMLIVHTGVRYFIFVVVMTIMNILTPLCTIYLTKEFIKIIELKKALVGNDFIVSLAIIVLAILFINFLSALFSGIMEIISFKTTEKMDDLIQEQLVKKMQEIEYSNFDNPTFLDELYKASDYSSEVLKSNLMMAVKAITSAVSLGFVALILWSYSTWVLLITLFSSIFSTVLNLYVQKLRQDLYNENVILNRKMDYFQGCMRDPLVIREYRQYDAVKFIMNKFSKNWNEYITRTINTEKKELRIGLLSQLVRVSAYCANYLVVGSMVLNNRILLNDFIYLVTLIQTFVSCLMEVLSVLPESKKNGMVLKNYNAILSKKSKNNIHGLNFLEKENIDIEFQNVSFKYPGSEKYVLKNISFKIPANTLVGIVGVNGAGKSTIVKLILGMYEPSEGKILVNGKNKAFIDYGEFIKKCSVIFQDYSKYAVTVKESIYMGNTFEEIDETLLKQSADNAGVTGYIQKLKGSWNQELTKKLTEDGIELSGGQWQRLALARSFYKQTPLVILDEPTASLDSKIECDMFSRMKQKDTTRIIISHRLGDLIKADIIMLIDNGSICEMGTHKELMELNGRYAHMFDIQSKNYN